MFPRQGKDQALGINYLCKTSLPNYKLQKYGLSFTPSLQPQYILLLLCLSFTSLGPCFFKSYWHSPLLSIAQIICTHRQELGFIRPLELPCSFTSCLENILGGHCRPSFSGQVVWWGVGMKAFASQQEKSKSSIKS